MPKLPTAPATACCAVRMDAQVAMADLRRMAEEILMTERRNNVELADLAFAILHRLRGLK